ncbi:hypothetical protein PSM7751_01879 [Pseudooceanicola marinus]|uniref:Uncharacterized protein n=1 Tax=Pseudooceanicola marinus TaxID=396013 RepID=A0A1X6Z5B2_9RHOB|nr:hypothetical protein [Pseudooceanicola marinus]PJE32251.1 hypothetical protein CVM50_04850 [Pseudooceanicola marinus]SLN40955.1 hypothetical protein PSM7751_01879 [Pseudooceanicola marinus]
MDITVTYQRGPTDPGAGPVKIGWLLGKTDAPVIYEPPRRVHSREARREHAKSASRCPAVVGLESRYFEVLCPFDLNIGFTRDKDGKPVLRNLSGEKSAVRGSTLGKRLTLVNEGEWRYPDRPIIQLKLPYYFITDEPVYMTQLEAYMYYRKTPLPGTIFGGRFPINLWPRPLMWAFEWHDTAKPITIRRGEPLFYVQFEADGPDRTVQMVEAEMTDELQTYMDHIGGAVNYVNQTFSLFEAAERVRPERLLKVKEK